MRLAKTNGNLFVACSGYPNCRNTLSMPKGISNLQMLDTNCPQCLKKTGREVKQFSLEFEAMLVNEVMA